MWNSISRLLMATWFVGMVVVAVWNGSGAAAQVRGNERLYFPIIEHNDKALHDYMGLVQFCCDAGTTDYYTVRGDGKEWAPLVLNVKPGLGQWSPNGLYFIYKKDSATWLLSLATRTPRLILESPAESVFWSPDSRYAAIFTYHEVYFWNVETEQRSDFYLPSVPYINPGFKPVWSPDSQALAWHGSPEPDAHDLWVWGGEGTGPRVVYQSRFLGRPYWSPDSTRLLFNGGDGNIYETNKAGDPAILFLEAYDMSGWLEGGARLALLQAEKLYLAQADGSAPTLFFTDPELASSGNVFVSPTGKSIAVVMRTRHFIQATTSATATFITECRGEFQWQAEGNLFSCSALSGTKIGDALVDPPAIIQQVSGGHAQFLPHSTNYIALERSRTSWEPGYPVPAPDYMDIVDIPTGVVKRLTYPGDDEEPVIEWRYLP